ncbi:cortical protein marker for cell polarity-domain-containing protein [Pseudomassariella vexata]|uniref:Cortical protein marker for cell polarity-domain-containing protein n=1 Tax=Pseudomassariella vexata TaxID=1141098 RepID=A0A1Y2E4U4_9PEZI|nr:cortical protein marker for cell polarity-domain-containing protein [Pseudomassariella vexata]ORY66457.1 cortical protein marker for cell polarity-domain-containing protein [Pseudomassariella vexata]
MRIPFRRRPAMRNYIQSSTSCLLTLTSFVSISRAITVTSVSSPELDLSQLGRVGIAGDFTGISMYEFEGQTEAPFITNGSESLMTRLPNGMFLSVLDTDASIQSMCVFGDAVILGGNFTSLGGQKSPGIASFDVGTSKITSLVGLTGQVNSLLCDNDAGMVYVGGSFTAANSHNAITWTSGGNWASLPFAGFNGPVETIAKASTGHIIFGGGFSGLGNTSTPSEPDGQVINLSAATIEADQGTSTSGFSDPKNIICQTSGVDGSGTTWLLEDNTAGTWRASFRFGFEPTKLRLWNTHQDGRGTKTWRFTALPINGIMNFTYTDPATNQNRSCTSECPLSDNTTVEFQDFHFVNKVGMNAFRIDVSAWYGNGGGLNGIELFEDDVFAYAINDFNEPSCATNVSFPSTATATGPWATTSSGKSSSDYLTAQLDNPTSESASVVFFPDIKESGNYTITIYTPGCIQDGTCSSRGQVNVTYTLTADGQPGFTQFYQTNNFDKYDSLGMAEFVDASSDSFRPSVTLTPMASPLSNVTVVAQRVQFVLTTSTGGLNGLYEYDPAKTTIDTADFKTSAFDKLASSFSAKSAVRSLVTSGDITYIGGNFSSSSVKNIVAIDSRDNSTVALDGGLNGSINSLCVLKDKLYAAGNFNSTQDGSASGLNYIAAYDKSSNVWSPLGAGVDAPVESIVPMALNISSDTPEDVITLTGGFRTLLAFGSNDAVAVDGFAVWVTSQNNWLQNLDGNLPSIDGLLTTALLNLSDGSSLYAGSISAQTLKADSAATLSGSIGTFPIDITSTSNATNGASIAKRASLANRHSTLSGVVTGAFYESGDHNLTILAGHFTASTTNGSSISNVILIDGNDETTTGLPAGISDESVFLALAVQGNNLFAGGDINGTISDLDVRGFVSYNLVDRKFNTQPPSLTGAKGVVSSINVRPNTGDVYVGGSFAYAGSLECPGVCTFSTSNAQWNRPGFGLEGDVNGMIWSSDTTLVVGGNLTLNNSNAFLASYDASKSTWSGFPSASSLPGPVDALTAANSDGTQVWASGTATNGSVYLMKYDGVSWKSLEPTFDEGTTISSLQVFSLSSSHDSSDLVDANQVLMITGSLAIPGFGTASSATFNGTVIQPYALTGNAGNTVGSIAKIFVQKQNFFTSSDGHLALGFVVLIALAVSLGLMLLIVVAGLALDRYRKKREGYVPAPTSMYDRGSGMQRIPPHELLDSLTKGRPGVPHV